MNKALDCFMAFRGRGSTIDLPRGEPLALNLTIFEEALFPRNLANDTIVVRVFREEQKVGEWATTSTGAQERIGRANALVRFNRSVEPGTLWFEIWLTNDGNSTRIYPATALRLLETTSP